MTLNSTNLTHNDEFFQPSDVPDSFKKAVGVVQIAMGKLGFLHRKLYNVLLANAYEGLGEGNRQFAIQASTLAELSGFDSRDYQLVYDHCKELLETTVEFVEFDNKDKTGKRRRKRRGATSLISDFTVSEGGLVTYSYSSEMANKLYEPEQYIWMAISTQKKFNSKYELNLFENCIRYVRAGTTGFKTVQDWRSILGATDATYDEFKRLNTMVLKPATNGVNSKSGILIEPEFERERRKISRIKFRVTENPQMQLLDYKAHSRIRNMETYKLARDFGLDDVEVIHWIETKGEQYLLDGINYVRAKKQTKNPAGYLVTTLRKGYAEKTPIEYELEKIAAEKTKIALERQTRIKEEEALEDKLKLAFETHRDVKLKEILGEIGEVEKTELGQIVAEGIHVIKARRAWEKIGYNSDRISDLGRAEAALIRHRLKEVVFKKWGNEIDRSLETFKKTHAG